MPSWSDNGEGINVLGCPSAVLVRPFVRTDLVVTMSHEWLEQFRHETYREYSVAPKMTWFDFWRSKVKVTASRRGGEGIFVNAGATKFIV